ncbi:MAG: S8 family peptidase [Pseudomonadota bacterium]
MIETVGAVDNFFNALRRSQLRWLSEGIAEDIEPDDDFFRTDDPTRLLGGRLYLSMADQSAIVQLLSLWETWQQERKLPWGLGAFKDVFERTRKIRFWNANDRLNPEVIQDWRSRLAVGQQIIPVELELVFSRDPRIRNRKLASVQQLVEEMGGTCAKTADIQSIEYQAALVHMPESQIRQLLENADQVDLALADEILYFRSVGQSAANISASHVNIEEPTGQPSDPEAEPIVALLDGLPAGHPWLDGFISLDDADDWADSYPAASRRHGSAMASLIVHGDKSAAGEPSTRRIYVRPILKPSTHSFVTPPPEVVPEDELLVDLIHRAVTRIFEQPDGSPGGSPEVRIINLSIGDPNRLFYREMSPCARLLDWLSWKHKVLFVVSAGNHAGPIVLPLTRQRFREITNEEREELVLQALYEDRQNRRIMSPAESVNAVTVGPVHSDLSAPLQVADVYDPIGNAVLPCATLTISAGMNRSTKPEVLFPAGRIFYALRLDGNGETTTLLPQNNLAPPGHYVALPARAGGAGAGHTRGSSNSAALATRAAAQIYEAVIGPNRETRGLSRAEEVCLMKALLIHGASWGPDESKIRELLIKNEVTVRTIRDPITCFLGYGCADVARTLGSAEQRATMIRTGWIASEEGHQFQIPIPRALGGIFVERRVIVTLAWLTPCNGKVQNYRKANLWADIPASAKNPLRVQRTEADHRTVRRGTVQHEIMTRDIVVDLPDNPTLPISVNCAAGASRLDTEIPYALVVTLEVPEETSIPIYDQIRVRISQPVAVEAQ